MGFRTGFNYDKSVNGVHAIQFLGVGANFLDEWLDNQLPMVRAFARFHKASAHELRNCGDFSMNDSLSQTGQLYRLYGTTEEKIDGCEHKRGGFSVWQSPDLS